MQMQLYHQFRVIRFAIEGTELSSEPRWVQTKLNPFGGSDDGGLCLPQASSLVLGVLQSGSRLENHAQTWQTVMLL